MRLRGRKHRSEPSEKGEDKDRKYSVYASECMLLPGYIEQSITLDEGTKKTGRDIWKRSIRFEVDPKSVKRDGEHGHIYRGYSQSHRLGRTAPGKLKSFKKIVKSIHKDMEQKIEDSHRCGKLDYISDVLEVALSEGSLLVHQWKLEVLENPFGRRRNWQAQFIRLGACETGIRKRGEKYKRRDVSRDDTFGRFNNSRVARGLGVQLSNNEKRSRKRHDRMRRPSQSESESTGSRETASSVNSYSGPSHGRRRRSSPRHYDGYTSGHNEDDSSDDDSDTRSYASSGFSKPSRSSSYGSRSSVASGSSRSNSEYGSRHRSGRHNKYQTNDQLRKPPSHQPDFKHGYGSIPPDYGTRPPGYGTIPPEGLPYPDEPYPGRSQPHYPYDDRADYTYDDGADNPYDDRADNPYRRS